MKLDADALFDFAGLFLRVEAEHSSLARAWLLDALDDFQSRRLARAVRAEHSENFTWLDFEGGIVDGRHIAEFFDQILNLDDTHDASDST